MVASTNVNGSAASRYADNTFALAGFTVTNGNNTFTAIAQDSLGRKDTNTVSVNLPTTVTFSYDQNGNLTGDGRRAFDYDDENQLIRVTVANSWKSEFSYDGRMRRRIRKEFNWVSSAWAQTAEFRYVYDGAMVVQERDGNNLPLVVYTRGRDLSAKLQAAGGIGGVLARVDAPSGQTAFFHSDGSGNITVLVNGQQVVVARYTYDPYGNTLSLSGPLAAANLYRFSSKEYHVASGLYAFAFRFYDPNLQRWLTPDPLGEAAGPNLFAYVHNASLRLMDPLGLDPLNLDPNLFGLGKPYDPNDAHLGLFGGQVKNLLSQDPKPPTLDPNGKLLQGEASAPFGVSAHEMQENAVEWFKSQNLGSQVTEVAVLAAVAAGGFALEHNLTGQAAYSGSLPPISLGDEVKLTLKPGFQIGQNSWMETFGFQITGFYPLDNKLLELTLKMSETVDDKGYSFAAELAAHIALSKHGLLLFGCKVKTDKAKGTGFGGGVELIVPFD